MARKKPRKNFRRVKSPAQMAMEHEMSIIHAKLLKLPNIRFVPNQLWSLYLSDRPLTVGELGLINATLPEYSFGMYHVNVFEREDPVTQATLIKLERLQKVFQRALEVVKGKPNGE